MASWAELTAAGGEIGDLAERVRARFEATGLGFLATLRADGSPRITGIEPTFGLGELWLGSMEDARKGADLRRDGRLALHAATVDKQVAAGDAKVAGRAVLVDDPAVHAAFGQLLGAGGGEHPEPGTFDLFKVDVDEIGFLLPAGDHLVIEWWNEPAGYRRIERR
ncbi:MAG TPA: pyridoxamine 5'-phosphate oxidase family protein [Acidimicrobiales bacterium]